MQEQLLGKPAETSDCGPRAPQLPAESFECVAIVVPKLHQESFTRRGNQAINLVRGAKQLPPK